MEEEAPTRRGSSRRSAKEANRKISSSSSSKKKATSGRNKKQTPAKRPISDSESDSMEQGDDEEDNINVEIDDDVPEDTRRAIHRAASGRVMPSRNRKQVKKGADEDMILAYLGSDDDDLEEEMAAAQRKRTRRGDLADLNMEDDLVLPGGAQGAYDDEKRLDVVLDRRDSVEEPGTFEYQVKWQNRSYLHVEWVPQSELLASRGTKNR